MYGPEEDAAVWLPEVGVREALREAGIADVHEARYAVLETIGRIAAGLRRHR